MFYFEEGKTLMKKLMVFACFAFAAQFCDSADENDGRPPAAIQFKKAQQTLTAADEARDKNRHIDAITSYREALNSYVKLSKTYPDWQPGVTQFRVVYCNNQLEALLKKADAKDLAAIAVADKINTMEKAEIPPSANDLPKPVEAPPNRGSGDKSVLQAVKAQAMLLLEKGETEKARSLLLDAIQHDPDDNNMRLLMAMVHCKAGEFDNAVYLMEPLVQEDQSNAVARVVLGTAYFGLGRIPDATKQMTNALKINPNLGEAHFNLAQLMLAGKTPDPSAARSHYKTSLELGVKPDPKLDILLAVPETGKK